MPLGEFLGSELPKSLSQSWVLVITGILGVLVTSVPPVPRYTLHNGLTGADGAPRRMAPLGGALLLVTLYLLLLTLLLSCSI